MYAYCSASHLVFWPIPAKAIYLYVYTDIDKYMYDKFMYKYCSTSRLVILPIVAKAIYMYMYTDKYIYMYIAANRE